MLIEQRYAYLFGATLDVIGIFYIYHLLLTLAIKENRQAVPKCRSEASAEES